MKKIVTVVMFLIAVFFVANCNINWKTYGFNINTNTINTYHIVECDTNGVCNYSEF